MECLIVLALEFAVVTALLVSFQLRGGLRATDTDAASQPRSDFEPTRPYVRSAND